MVDLVLQVAKEPAKYLLQDGVDTVDRDGLSSYRAKYDELEEELNESQLLAEEGKSSFRSESDIRTDMTVLYEHIMKVTGLGNRPRKIADDRDRVRKSFQAAIRRVKKEIGKYDKRLAEHLKPPVLRCGWSPRYDPHDDILWDT